MVAYELLDIAYVFTWQIPLILAEIRVGLQELLQLLIICSFRWTINIMSIHMIKNISILGFVSATLLVSSCQNIPTQLVNQVNCSEPRPEICTMDYQPVCGFNSDNSSKTYSNACVACSDKEVVKYIKGECLEWSLILRKK